MTGERHGRRESLASAEANQRTEKLEFGPEIGQSGWVLDHLDQVGVSYLAVSYRASFRPRQSLTDVIMTSMFNAGLHAGAVSVWPEVRVDFRCIALETDEGEIGYC